MNHYYTLKQAMELLGLRSINAFRQLVRKHPEVFMNISFHANRHQNPWYDKAAVDKFVEAYKLLKQEKT